MVTNCQGYRPRHLTGLAGGQWVPCCAGILHHPTSMSQLCSLEQHTLSLKTRETNVIALLEMSKSTERQTFYQLTYSSQSRFGVWAQFA